MTQAAIIEDFTVQFQPSGFRGKVPAGTSLRTAARMLGVQIESVCAEIATCGKCVVMIEHGSRGRIESSFDHLSPMSADEKKSLVRHHRATQQRGFDIDCLRLSCQAKVQGDVVAFVPESSRRGRQIVRKAATDRPIELRPAVRRYYVELEPATLENPLGHVERLAVALTEVMGRVHQGGDVVVPDPDDLTFDYPVLRCLSDAIHAGEWSVSVAVWDDREVIDVRAGYHDEAFGAAIDIGSTSIALYLSDLVSGELVATDSMMNPQIAFGDDVMSRMAFEAGNEDGLASLHESVLDSVNALLKRARRTQDLDPEDILELVVVGNTTMHHYFLNLPAEHLGLAPYVPTVHRSLDIKARDLGLDINPAANVHLLPVEAGFVGADNLAVLIAEEPYNQDDELLIIDVGTNAELVLGNRDRLLCTSTPTGPAFEGGHVEYGMRAAPGAIEHVSIDESTLEPSCELIGFDGDEAKGLARGICGSAIIDGVAEMFRVGIIDARGRFIEPPPSPRVRLGEFGMEFVIAWDHETSIGRDIPLTTRDVREIQLAKAALYSAAQILLREAGLERPDKVILAGAFGSHIDPTCALILGMIPDCPLESVYSVGNAAGDGARIALLNRAKRREAIEVARSIRHIELPIDPDFQNQYMLALNFPHMSHSFPSIADLIPDSLPDPMAHKFQEKTDAN